MSFLCFHLHGRMNVLERLQEQQFRVKAGWPEPCARGALCLTGVTAIAQWKNRQFSRIADH